MWIVSILTGISHGKVLGEYKEARPIRCLWLPEAWFERVHLLSMQVLCTVLIWLGGV